ncbi:acyltransferase [Shewanella sp. 2_MG-2023]|nr:acyltransferase [Shewanella sp. 2_MG-2023]
MLPHVVRYKVYYRDRDIKSSAFFKGQWTKVYGDGSFYVGANSYCGTNCGFNCETGQKIVIGNNVSISHNVRIYTSNRNPVDIMNNRALSLKVGDVTIGDNVWIGANVIIVQDVNIGSNVVIGANSVVSKNVDSNCIVAGAPLKILKKCESNSVS